jgi:hypothetical protein
MGSNILAGTAPEITSGPHAGTAVAGGTSLVEWGAIFAGAIIAVSLLFVLTTFGGAIGLSLFSPTMNAGGSSKVITTAAAIWTVAQQMGACMAGGYVAGRMLSRTDQVLEHESEFRQGLHGALSWAVSLLITAIFVITVLGGIERTETGASRGSTFTEKDLYRDVVDLMLRSKQIGVAEPPDQRGEVIRIVAKSVATGVLSDMDRTYLVSIVIQRTGLPQVEAGNMSVKQLR